MEDCAYLVRRFHQIHFSHTKCKGNRVAHRLACFAYHIAGEQMWIEEEHDVVASVLRDEAEFV